MLKKKKAVIAIVLACFIVFAAFVCNFLASTVSAGKIANSLDSSAVYTEIVDGADYGCKFQKFKIETSPYGDSYVTVYEEAPFGLIKSTGRYYMSYSNELNDEIGYHFSAMKRDYSEYAYVFFGNNSQQAEAFEISIDTAGIIRQKIDSSKPFVCVFADSDFNSDETLVNNEKTVRLLDSNDNVVLEQII